MLLKSAWQTGWSSREGSTCQDYILHVEFILFQSNNILVVENLTCQRESGGFHSFLSLLTETSSINSVKDTVPHGQLS